MLNRDILKHLNESENSYLDDKEYDAAVEGVTFCDICGENISEYISEESAIYLDDGRVVCPMCADDLEESDEDYYNNNGPVEEPQPRVLSREEWDKEFGPGADPDVINAGREPEERVELRESEFKRYRVSFYVDTDSMNNIEIEEAVDQLLKGSGLASTDETIEVERVD